MSTSTQLQNVVTALRAKRDEQKALRSIKWANGFKQEARGHREAAKAYDRAVGLVKRIQATDLELAAVVDTFIDDVQGLI